jgi:hypothetical protein
MDKKRHGPKKGAGRKWAERLKQLGEQPPPKELMDKINSVQKPVDKKEGKDS